MHRVLDPCGTTTVLLDQKIAARMVILHTRQAANLGAQERDFRQCIAMGRSIIVDPHADSTTFFNGDGHEQNFIGERGLQTRMVPPSGHGGGARERDFASCGYGR
jgi:hypothetical protein